MSKAVAFPRYGDPDVLTLIDVPEPQAGDGQIRVRVRVAGVNPVDCKVRGGKLDGYAEVVFPQVLGNEFAGVVDEVGAGVSGIAAGDEVLGFTAMAAYAEFVVVDAAAVVLKPDAMSWEVAGGISAVGQAACGSLRALHVSEGETVLIHAAAGGVGTVAVQLSRLWGAKVIGTASERNHDYLRSLGAIPVSYGDGLLDRIRAAAPAGVDAALDLIGGDSVAVSVQVVEDRQRIGTIADFAAPQRYGIQRIRYERSTAVLSELAELNASGRLTIPIQRSFPLADAAAAHREVEGGHVRGKVVLVA